MDGAHHLGEPVRRTAAFIIAAFASTVALAEDTSNGLGGTIRDVTPPGMTPAPKVDGPLERIPPPPRPPQLVQWRRFALPVTTDAATFVTAGATIRVLGVVPPPANQTCHRTDGSDWPCGQAALTGLRRFLRGRDVECYYAPSPGETDIVAPCRVGPTDIGAWLLTEGWATPADTASDDYRKDADEARCDRRGLWDGTVAPADCPAEP
jgi:endonuclease YncB( thermonuclease family)